MSTVGGKSPLGFHAHFLNCLVEGTSITVWDGKTGVEDILIENVSETNWVLGVDRRLRKVQKAWITKEEREIVSVMFANHSVVSGTKEHPVWTNNRGWVELQSLITNDEVVTLHVAHLVADHTHLIPVHPSPPTRPTLGVT